MFARRLRSLILSFVALTASCTADTVDDGPSAGSDEALRRDCDAVRCALPECGDGQHLAYQGGSCCPTCVGRPSRCATVLCAAVACPEGQQLVTSPGDCCGHCVPKPAVAECTTTDDCPVYNCIRCPCPYSECVGRKCVTRTPAESTCGGS